jgi:cytoskeletal protein CcmA (bactofilin family)
MIGCTQHEDNHHYTLGKGEVVSGPLLIWEQNATLEEGSSVEGSVIMFCCNLIVDGSVDGSVYLISGNLRVNTPADITGDVSVLSGNVSK